MNAPFRTQSFRDLNGAGDAYPIARLHAADESLTIDDLDIAAMKRLELIRIATRVTPLLGLMATLIPMGPALVALTRNDVSQMGELLRSAFSSVVLALAAAALCFCIATVKRRWYVEELLLVQIAAGTIMAHSYYDRTSFYGIAINDVFPFNFLRAVHIQAPILWIGLSWIGAERRQKAHAAKKDASAYASAHARGPVSILKYSSAKRP